jgi:hypothetical protein
MPRYIAKVFDERACANSMGGLRGPGRDFQHLTECANSVSSHSGGAVRAGISDHDDPQRSAPTGMAIRRKYTQDAFGNGIGLIPRSYDNPNRLDLRRQARYWLMRDSAGWSGELRHALRIAGPA